jgi:hypothetical protein
VMVHGMYVADAGKKNYRVLMDPPLGLRIKGPLPRLWWCSRPFLLSLTFIPPDSHGCLPCVAVGVIPSPNFATNLLERVMATEHCLSSTLSRSFA